MEQSRLVEQDRGADGLYKHGPKRVRPSWVWEIGESRAHRTDEDPGLALGRQQLAAKWANHRTAGRAAFVELAIARFGKVKVA